MTAIGPECPHALACPGLPYSGTVAGGYVWGRGALDVKVCGALCAVVIGLDAVTGCHALHGTKG
jgi:acetylornithine deacetylase/succinyl-diaminopimelate desuccinylase-like protein